ncbi:MAG TPA: NAD(P)-binding domain-containing protein, partial [Gemmatimonadales bacterium]|nr:NAD(P)-binding domain-containing protein [Gemmatimonadales bacterium]
MKVAVIGAAGYAGGELLRLLHQHPEVDGIVATSRSQAGRPVASVHPQLATVTDATFSGAVPAEAAAGADVVYLALEHGESSRVAGEILARKPKLVVDIAADFRTSDLALYERFYGPHPAPALVPEFTYALADLAGTALRGKRALAAPGCFATAAQ